MITYWVYSGGVGHIQSYLEQRGAPVRERFFVQPYDFSKEHLEVPSGIQIFTAMDQLTDPERNAAREIRNQLLELEPRLSLLNDPIRCLFLRATLLNRLADEGINAYRVYPAREPRTVARFPVFVRHAYDHHGNRTGLLNGPEALRRALRALRLQGHRLDDLLIVEFCDTSDRHGVFRKYGAMRVGDAIIPTHVFAGRSWMMKGVSAERTEELSREGLEFVERNPHERWLREVFTIAGVEYGRADYAVSQAGRPQLWEINTHPSLRVHSRPMRDQQAATIWDQIRERNHAGIREAFVALDKAGSARQIRLSLDPSLRARIRAVQRRVRLRRAASTLQRKIYQSRVAAPLVALLEKDIPMR